MIVSFHYGFVGISDTATWPLISLAGTMVSGCKDFRLLILAQRFTARIRLASHFAGVTTCPPLRPKATALGSFLRFMRAFEQNKGQCSDRLALAYSLLDKHLPGGINHQQARWDRHDFVAEFQGHLPEGAKPPA